MGWLTGWWSSEPQAPPEPPKPAPLPDPDDLVDPEDYRAKLKSRQAYTKFYDPCEAAAKASMECLNRNDYDRDACTDYFQAYRDCKKTWMDQKAKDKREGKRAY